MSDILAVRERVSLAPYNTMGLAAQARFFVEVGSKDELKKALQFASQKSIPVYLLGGGSNVLFVDDFMGMVIHIHIKGKEIREEDDKHVILDAGAGENWHQLVMYCVERGWGGIENLSLIPGSVGAAPIQNIGAYGVELQEVFESLEALEIETGNIRTFTKDECQFGYRDSIFKNNLKGKYVITSVAFRLQKNPEINTSYAALSEKLKEDGVQNPSIKEVSEAVIDIRQSKLPDPAKIGNTGSFFKNPVISQEQFNQLKQQYPDIPHYPVGDEIKIPAAWLIDQCGWKGKRFGDAGVHKVHALVIVNYGNATGQEIWKLANEIQESVTERFGIALHPEVNVVGPI